MLRLQCRNAKHKTQIAECKIGLIPKLFNDSEIAPFRYKVWEASQLQYPNAYHNTKFTIELMQEDVLSYNEMHKYGLSTAPRCNVPAFINHLFLTSHT